MKFLLLRREWWEESNGKRIYEYQLEEIVQKMKKKIFMRMGGSSVHKYMMDTGWTNERSKNGTTENVFKIYKGEQNGIMKNVAKICFKKRGRKENEWKHE